MFASGAGRDQIRLKSNPDRSSLRSQKTRMAGA
jgi:hypothetical protein